MSNKGHRYAYQLKSIYPQELEQVIFDFTQNGWKYIETVLDEDPPFKVIFEWTRDGPWLIPFVNWPPP